MLRQGFWLGFILLIGLALRVRGLQWGLPAPNTFFHGSSYHPDEQALFNGLKELSWQKKQFYPTDIQMLSRGPLQVYVVGVALGLASPWLTTSRDREFYKKRPEALRRLYLIGRCVSVVQSFFAIAALFWLGALIDNWKVGAGAAALLAIAPVQVVNSHYISTDSAFCLYLILLTIACHHILKTASTRSYLAAGVLWGLLTANKYNAASAGLMIGIAHFLSSSPKKSYRSLLTTAAIAGAVFLVCDPAVVFGFNDFVSALSHSYRSNIMLRHFMYDAGYPPNAVRFYTWDAPLYGLGLPLFAICLTALFYASTHFSRVQWLWFPWIILYWIALWQSGWRLVRWIMPLTPFLFLEVARMWNGATLLKHRPLLRYALATFVLGYTFLYSYCYVQAMSEPDVRDTSSDWIVHHIPKGERIAMKGKPYFWTPTIFQSPYYHPDEAETLRKEWGYQTFYISASLKELREYDPSYAILTCYDIDVYLRSPGYYQGFPQGQFIAELLNSKKYKIIASFEKKIQFANHEWFGDTYNFPHDWRYPFPKILILEKIAAP